jgi:hypothetical protein
MIEPASRSRVWRSTEPNRAAGQVSVLAVAETLACVVVYWLLWLWLGVTWHHWLILIATPLVLLRSEQSVALGVRWFKQYDDDFVSETKLHSARGITAVFALLIVSGLAAWGLTQSWLVGASGWALFGKVFLIGLISITLGVMAAAVVTGAVWNWLGKALGPWSWAPFPLIIAGLALVVWLRATLTRFAATACFVITGLTRLPSNWRFSILVSDVWHPPELLPGDEGLAYGQPFSFSRQKSDGSKKSSFRWFIVSGGRNPLN